MLVRLAAAFVPLLALLLLSYADAQTMTAGAKNCQVFTHYNALCTFHDIAFIVTSRPCLTSLDFLVTIIQPLNDKHEQHIVNKEKTFFIENNKTRVVFSTVFLTEGDYAGDSHTHLHFYDVGNETAHTIYEEFFFTGHNGPHLCENLMPGRVTYPSSRCNQTYSLDMYGSACYLMDESGAHGIYMTMFDPCTVPYHVSVAGYFPSLNQTVVRYYTGAKTDKIVPVIESSQCGFTMDYLARPNSGGHQQHIVLYHTCPGKENMKETVIDAYYQPDDGLFCHPSDCFPVTGYHSKCSTEIVGPFANQTLMFFDLKLDLCNHEQIHVTINLPNKTASVNTTLTGHDDTVPFVFDSHHKPNPLPANVTNGFITNEGGVLSFHVDEFEEENEIELSIIRHFPTMDDHIPLLHAVFSNSVVHCKSGSSSKHAVIASVVVIAVLLCIVAAVLIYFYQRRKAQGQGDGLPYHMEVNTFDDEDYMR